MIKKIIKIKNVGKFQNYAPKAETPFNGKLKKFTLIYGDNGIGKTTFTSILKSLKNNDRLLKRMRSFKYYLSPEVEILVTGVNKLYRYSDYKWNNHKSEIEIFDKAFIYENIYTGFHISSDHKKRLFDLILGEKGVSLKNEIEDIKGRIQIENVNLNKSKEKIQKYINRVIDVEEFLKLQPDHDIKKKIEKKEEEIQIAHSNKEIKEKDKLSKIQNDKLVFVFQQIKDILKKSIKTISADYLEKVEEHKKHLSMGIKTEQWIKDGYESIKDNKCPFCLRPFDKTTEIITAYNHYFNKEYVQLQEDIRDVKNYFTELNIMLIFSELEAVNTSNLGLASFWKPYVKAEFFNKVLFKNKALIVESFNKVKSLIIEKSNNPIQPKNIDKVAKFEELIQDLNQTLEQYNLFVEEYNNKIEKIKKISLKDITVLERELDSFKLIEKRHGMEGIKLCSEYIREKELLAELNEQKDKKKGELDKYTANIFSKYTEKINEYLKKFAPYLQVKKIKQGFIGKSKLPQVDYVLSVLDNEVRLYDDGYSPAFKHVMSEGDKSTLAFSFFLAKLKTDGNIENKVVVFDDPVASFDLNRKSATISVLNQIGANAKQLIVLTHNCLFAGKLWQEYVDKSDSICLQIRNIGKSSHFDEYKIDSETLLGIFKDMNLAKQYLETGARDDTERRNIVRCIRPILEGYYRIKFYGEIELDDMLGEIIRKISEASKGDRLIIMKEHLSELDDINCYSKKYYHAFNTAADEEPIHDGELKSYIQRTFKLIEES